MNISWSIPDGAFALESEDLRGSVAALLPTDFSRFRGAAAGGSHAESSQERLIRTDLLIPKKPLRALRGPPRLRPMLQTAGAPRVRTETTETREQYIQAYRWMLLARMLEEKIASLYRGGKI